LDGVDLADGTHGLQMASEIGAANGGTDAPASFGQAAHRVAANEARPTENRNQFALVQARLHACSPNVAKSPRLAPSNSRQTSACEGDSGVDVAFKRA
jgi:hypothetical protein